MTSNISTFRFINIFDIRSERILVTIGLLFGVIAGAWTYTQQLPAWVVAATIIAGLLPAYTRHVWTIYTTHGWWSALLTSLVAAQSFHGVEHVVQWIQYHILRMPFFKASGIISAANAEWVHFLWNWAVLIIMVVLVAGGLRNKFAWMMLAWTFAHTAEHTYLMWQYQQTLAELAQLGAWGTSAQGLPGFFGRDGWIATSDITRDTFLCRLPGITTAVRLDVHFYWNVGETTLLILATHFHLNRHQNLPKPQTQGV